MTSLFKFPRTPHLAWLAKNAARGDRVLSSAEMQAFLSGEIVVEEKVDGANIGISVSAEGHLVAQNRGSNVAPPVPHQFQPLGRWLTQKEVDLVQALGSDLILFGEWCFAVHSVRYDRLPDYFLAFDVYDRSTKRFWSSVRRNELLSSVGLAKVPEIGRGKYGLEDLLAILKSRRSEIGTALIEGLYLRREAGGWLQSRAKLVRPEFLDHIQEHWSSRILEKNQLAC